MFTGPANTELYMMRAANEEVQLELNEERLKNERRRMAMEEEARMRLRGVRFQARRSSRQRLSRKLALGRGRKRRLAFGGSGGWKRYRRGQTSREAEPSQNGVGLV